VFANLSASGGWQSTAPTIVGGGFGASAWVSRHFGASLTYYPSWEEATPRTLGHVEHQLRLVVTSRIR
jgi:hypothetical protein